MIVRWTRVAHPARPSRERGFFATPRQDFDNSDSCDIVVPSTQPAVRGFPLIKAMAAGEALKRVFHPVVRSKVKNEQEMGSSRRCGAETGLTNTKVGDSLASLLLQVVMSFLIVGSCVAQA